jgi:two-component system, OmpR family, alkaline phosphatase synthesis response regulator PhoP
VAKILLLAREDEEQRRTLQELRRGEHVCGMKESLAEGLASIEEDAPDLVVVAANQERYTTRELKELVQACGGNNRIPLIALLTNEQLENYDFSIGIDDFQIVPFRLQELAARVQQALWRVGKVHGEDDEVLRCGDLVIDTTRYEVYVAGRPMELTFKEYELLRFLATNQDKVFTREILLNRVWGYDYFGGARTVDVHIRRLRSKIEDRDHSFIETVRNVGYRFRPSSPRE